MMTFFSPAFITVCLLMLLQEQGGAYPVDLLAKDPLAVDNPDIDYDYGMLGIGIQPKYKVCFEIFVFFV